MSELKKVINDNIILSRIKNFAAEEKADVYIVGGFIRDFLLNKEADYSDIDIMIIGDATDFALKFANHYNYKLNAVYKNFGTALVVADNMKLEFASSRKESYKRTSRKPDVEFGYLDTDLARRDFTINALAINVNNPEIIIDKYNGLSDIKNKILKTPLDPDITFFDDPLRMLRAIRFASRLGFKIDENTFASIIKNKDRLKEDNVVSQERITKEFLMILETPKPSLGLNLLYISGLMEIIFPEISALAGVDQRKDYHHKDVFYHTLEVIDNISEMTNDVWLRFTALTHDIAKPPTKKFIEGTGWTFHGHEEVGARMMRKIFHRMRLPLNKLEYVQKLIRLHLRPSALANQPASDSAIRRLAAQAGEELEDLLILCRADITSKNENKIQKYMANYVLIENRIREVQEKDNLRQFQSPVRGDEIMRICQIPPGKPVGILKKMIEEAILEGEIPNEYEPALKYLLKIKDDVLKK